MCLVEEGRCNAQMNCSYQCPERAREHSSDIARSSNLEEKMEQSYDDILTNICRENNILQNWILANI